MVKSDTYFRQISKGLALLAMVIMLLVQSTPIWAKQSGDTPLIICTALGFKTIAVDQNGQEIPQPIKPTTNHCSVCHLSVDFNLIAQGSNPEAHIISFEKDKVEWPILPAKTMPQNINSHAIRAPPYSA